MSGITAQSIKELRERTLAGLSDCKNALMETEGDFEKAVELIKKLNKPIEIGYLGFGEVRASVSADRRRATMIEVNIQTDFATRDDAFKYFVGNALAVAEKAPTGANLANEMIQGRTISNLVNDLMARLGQKIAVRRWDCVEVPVGKHGLAHAYVHLGGKKGATR